MLSNMFIINTATTSVARHATSRGYMTQLACKPMLLVAIIFTLSLAIHRVQSASIADQTGAKLQTREPIYLEEAFLGELRAKEFSFDWLTGDETDDKDVSDELIYEDSRNILLVTLPSIERRAGPNSTLGAQPRLQTSGLRPNVSTLVSNSSAISQIEFQGYRISPSKKYLLLWNSRRKQFRHSSTAKYFLYDIKSDSITLLSTRSNSTTDSRDADGLENDALRFQVVEWYSKKTDKGSIESLIMIQNNDIYHLHDVSRLASGPESGTSNVTAETNVQPKRLTTTGKNSVVFNGVPDWLYEEEILSDTPAYQVSPLGDHLAYMSFNDSNVNIMPFTIYGEQTIPRVQRIRYPKAGQPNPRVSVHIVANLSSAHADGQVKSAQLELPSDLTREQYYINRINWLSNTDLALIWSNRNQNTAYFVICSQTNEANNTWECRKNLNLRSQNGWLDISDDLLPLDSNHYLALIPKNEGPDVGDFKHIALVSINEPNKFVYLTSGRREVVGFSGVDYKRSLVYYLSTAPDEPGQRQLFVAELESSTKDSSTSNHLNGTTPSGASEPSAPSVCVTCDHHPEGCLYNYARMSPTTNYYVFQCAGPDVPRTELRATRRRRHRNFQENLVNDTRQRKLLNESQSDTQAAIDESNNSNGQSSLLWTFEDNKELRDKLDQKQLPMTMRLKVPIPSTNYSADVLLLIPPLLHESAALQQQQQQISRFQSMTPEQYKSLRETDGDDEQFPMLVDVYGGPGSQKVDYRFSVYFGHYMASKKRTVYAMIDGRGSGYQGSKRLYELYHRLGTVEIQDQIDVTASLTRNLSFIDPARVAIWGWSYGGYAAAMSLVQSRMRAKGELLELLLTTATNRQPEPMPRSVFKCAASVAPVTNWIYYDTAYTEKYMSSPWANEQYDEFRPGDHLGNVTEEPAKDRDQLQANKWTPLVSALNSTHIRPRNTQPQSGYGLTSVKPEASVNTTVPSTNQSDKSIPSPSPGTNQTNDLNERYKKASLLDLTAHFDSKRFLLMHGTADDNVNFQQSIMLMKRLIKKNILFETRLYPDQDHGIANKADKLHLGSTLSDFLSECFTKA